MQRLLASRPSVSATVRDRIAPKADTQLPVFFYVGAGMKEELGLAMMSVTVAERKGVGTGYDMMSLTVAETRGGVRTGHDVTNCSRGERKSWDRT